MQLFHAAAFAPVLAGKVEERKFHKAVNITNIA